MGVDFQGSEHFTRAELADEATGGCILQKGFIERLEELRVAYGHPMIVTSGCRSGERNEWLRARGYPASPNSLHLMFNKRYGTNTCAVDIVRPDALKMVKLMREALKRGWSPRVAKRFVHLDLRAVFAGLPQVFDTYE